jgi:hypothetical protein
MLKFLGLALGYLPSVLQAVIAVENTLKGLAPGTAKKSVVLAAVSAASQVGETLPEAHVNLISALVDHTVGALNAAGVFGHTISLGQLPTAPLDKQP